MKLKIIIPIIVLYAILTGFTAPGNWVLFKYDDYSIEFPVAPKSETKMLNSSLGELKLNFFIYDASKSNKKDDNLVYMMMSTEYPDSSINSDDKESLTEIFRNGVDGAVKRVQGKLLSEKSIEIQGFPGREIKVDYKNGMAIIKIRLYLVRNKMYMLQVITETAKESNILVEKFLNSFTLK